MEREDHDWRCVWEWEEESHGHLFFSPVKENGLGERRVGQCTFESGGCAEIWYWGKLSRSCWHSEKETQLNVRRGGSWSGVIRGVVGSRWCFGYKLTYVEACVDMESSSFVPATGWKL